MNISYLLIGGNQGDRMDQLAKARERITGSGCTIPEHSSVYETAAWGKTDQPAFLNQALLICTVLDAPALLAELLKIELAMGRRREEKYGARTIDIDILFFNKEIITLPQLVVPHPEIQNRRFALVPMEEIAPQWQHPVFNKTITRLLKDCQDKLDVKKIVPII
ncbi:2-amino-4-hydroxy-6-hydroxymethyldihydropteridine diphosphokinase [Flavitalea flava]